MYLFQRYIILFKFLDESGKNSYQVFDDGIFTSYYLSEKSYKSGYSLVANTVPSVYF